MNFLGGGWFATFVVPLEGGGDPARAAQAVEGAVRAVRLGGERSGRAAAQGGFRAGAPRGHDRDFGPRLGPSGHTANAATIAVIAVVIVPRVWVAVVGAAWVFAMAFSRTQVHAHWFSDTVGGTLAGLGAALVAALFTAVLERERERLDR